MVIVIVFKKNRKTRLDWMIPSVILITMIYLFPLISLIGIPEKVAYIETWKAIDKANQILGYNGWSSSVINLSQDYVSESFL